MQRHKSEYWDSVARATQPKKIPEPDPSADPSESIMKLMKDLYNQVREAD